MGMLVFTIHGVATRDSNYSKPLEKLVKKHIEIANHQAKGWFDFFPSVFSPIDGDNSSENKPEIPLPIFASSFWGVRFTQTDHLWNGIRQGLTNLQETHHNVDIQDVFRYQELRQGFITDFFGDILLYLNEDNGRDIRQNIADQLSKAIRQHPEYPQIHLVAHSLGSVILWDVLFSERFTPGDPAYKIRALLNLDQPSAQVGNKGITSITTMGSPILFFNLMFDIKPAQIQQRLSDKKVRWLNLIHSSDIIAYPLRSIFSPLPDLFFRDKYIWADANIAEKAARSLRQEHAAMALGVSDGHVSYWHSDVTAHLLAANLMGNTKAIDSQTIDTE